MTPTDAVDDSSSRPARVTTRRHVGLAGALGVGAVAVLGVLQGAIGAFNPRPSVSVLIVAAVFCAGLWAQRIASRRNARVTAAAREAQLREILGSWPPEELPACDALRLGVYPLRRDADPDGPYVDRAVDPALRAAIAEGGVVLLHGPARSGKSRTAIEALCAARPGARLLAPRGRHALTELLALDPPIDLGEVKTVVWLDALERFAGTIDALSLDGLQALTRGSTVVLTVRDSDWTRLLAASGDRGETARAVAARARAFELPSVLTADEQAQAARLYPGIDLGSGIGAALAARGTEDGPPPARVVVEPETPDPVPRGSRDPELMMPLGGAVAALIAFALVWVTAGFSTPPPPSIDDQVATIRHDGAGPNRKAQDYQVHMHGRFSDASYYFRFRDDGGAGPPSSDEIRIYDPVNGRLKKRFSFQAAGPRVEFQDLVTRDVDGDGNRDLLGGLFYACPHSDVCDGDAQLPVAVSWSDQLGRYHIVSLNTGVPDITRSVAAPLAAEYRRRVEFTDPATGETVAGYRVQTFNITQNKRPRLIVGYQTKSPARYELHAWQFVPDHPAPFVIACPVDPRPPSAPINPNPDLVPGVILSTWRHERRSACP
jgi:hypothetical protein